MFFRFPKYCQKSNFKLLSMLISFIFFKQIFKNKLPNIKILVLGLDSDDISQSSCHLLDEGTWRSQPSLKTKRQDAAASLTKSGNMLVTGGSDGNTFLSSTEIFTGGQWEDGTELPVNMGVHCQVTTNEGVIVAGEIIESNLTVLLCVLL